MEKAMQCSVRNSELAVQKEKRAFLTYPAEGLASCELCEADDGIELAFDCAGLEPAAMLMKKSKEEKYRFLINAADLDKLSTEYEVSLSPDNLLVDINLRPQAMMRDAKHDSSPDFLSKYKALIGSILQPKYKYDDYLSGGDDLYKKQKLLSKIIAPESVEEIKDGIITEYNKTITKQKRTKKQVSKKYVIACNILIPILAASLIASCFLLWISMFVDIPFKSDVIDANSAYIAGEYIETQRALSRYDVSELSFESKYFLSRAYVITEALTDVQKDNILMGLTLRTDPVIFDYWILLGRLDFDEAIDIAQRLGDDELLLFAYLKYEVVVRNDISMPGEEKTALLGDLAGRIDRLERAREAAMEEIAEDEMDEDE